MRVTPKLIVAALLAVAAPLAAHAQTTWGGTYGSLYGGMNGTSSNSGSHYTGGYTRENGTYVNPYHATNPNSTQLDNYGTRGNMNPWTGTMGRRGAGY